MDNSKPIWVEEEKKIHLFVATPVHSEVSIHYAQSLLELQKVCWKNNIGVTFQLMKSSLVTQGRNLCVSGFLESNCTHMLFIDSDIAFNPSSVLKLLELNKEIISMVYPMKTMNMVKLKLKIESGVCKDESKLQGAGLTYPVRLTDDNDSIRIDKDGVVEADHMPTGFMMLQRGVFDKLIKAYPDKKINQKTVINGEMVMRPNFWNFFDTFFCPESKVYLGEDFAFCKLWSDIGGKCFIYINDYITHVGEFQYTGRLMDEMTKQEVEKPCDSE
jgi:hypothetical protein